MSCHRPKLSTATGSARGTSSPARNPRPRRVPTPRTSKSSADARDSTYEARRSVAIADDDVVLAEQRYLAEAGNAATDVEIFLDGSSRSFSRRHQPPTRGRREVGRIARRGPRRRLTPCRQYPGRASVSKAGRTPDAAGAYGWRSDCPGPVVRATAIATPRVSLPWSTGRCQMSAWLDAALHLATFRDRGCPGSRARCDRECRPAGRPVLACRASWLDGLHGLHGRHSCAATGAPDGLGQRALQELGSILALPSRHSR